MHAILAIALALLVSLPAVDAGAAIYTYKDENGRTVFVDDEHKVPAQYRGNASTIQEMRDLESRQAEGVQAEPEGQSVIDRETQMRARQQVEMLDQQRAHQTPVMVRGNRVMVPVEVAVGDRTSHLMLLLDTGATHTVFHRESVKNLPFQPGEKINAKVASGRTVKSEKVVARQLEIGPFVMNDFPVMLIDHQGSALPYDGLLGMDFLKDHPHEIDYGNEMIHWKAGNL